jgi:molybdopterin synthase catalytic subunit
MDIQAIIQEMQNHPRFNEAGMILTHFGLVRGFDLAGRPVSHLIVKHDEAHAEALRREMRKRPGVVEIILRLNSGTLRPGDPIMLAAVAGDTRQTVFPVLEELVNRLKTEAVEKSEQTASP